MGCHGCIVADDETQMFSRKYNVGRVIVSDAVCIIGEVCSKTNKVSLKAVVKSNQPISQNNY
jgi:hypothetical protein